ncbi:putative phage baseplate assembly protein [Amycolatopsis sulphurea]|uniref:Putative phage baseplate assembly protein n=1 Tax=Amycolatopsis sulphurea TaxID=76022 RepID=A0A2A9FJS1_9PSEU|nr:putative baseplate assembly protein [Amycolatopsis sulphurea]PFG50699.1 putative phage baseplate assembly protein [Amycolatopsis sulphurea]
MIDCTDERRRAEVRARERNGIDAVSVSDDRRTLTVLFFGKAPEGLTPVNFRIDGGRRITGIVVVAAELCVSDDPEFADGVRLTVDRPGDLSTYRLCVVEAGPVGNPGTKPYPGFDPRYACVDFTFTSCDDLDCAPADDCPQQTVPEPEIDYLSKDYASFRQLLLDRLSLTMPAWTERHVPDIGITLVELLAYEGDRLSYQQDAVGTEAYLDTARLRVSVRRHARLVDYFMHEGCSARAWVCLEADEQAELPKGAFRFASLPDGVLLDEGPALQESDLDRTGMPRYEMFEPVHTEPLPLRPAHNRISLWTWGDRECRLSKGATSATLADPDRDLRLTAGDVLVFEEVVGAKTGLPADADHTHRQVVRLTSVTETTDELYCRPLLEVTWAREDALAFSLCVNARGGVDCTEYEVGVARGNVVLVEHGARVDWCGGAPEHHDVPPPEGTELGCPDPVDFGCPDEARPARRPGYPPLPVRFRPELKHRPVTQSAPFPLPADVAAAQARRLVALPDRVRARLTRLWRAGEPPSDVDFEFVTRVFGAKLVAKLDLRKHPRRALRYLLARFDDLLETKLARVRQLIHRAHAGYVLTEANEGWEIGQSWGVDEGAALDENSSAFRGAAGPATQPDPRAALPAVTVTDRHGEIWLPRRDLLDSGPADRDFVGELDDDGAVVLRFGDGRNGAEYPLGGTLTASLRVGTGVAGNVGREAINRIVLCRVSVGGIRVVRNPLPAGGGADPEPVSEVRTRAPQEARHRLLRAITAEDYATLAGQTPGVQRAAADLRWTGSWYEAQAGVDPLGAEVAPEWLLDEVRAGLYPYRRIGHDLAVSSATLVPLDLVVHVEVRPEYLAAHVRVAVRRVLAGFFAPDNLTFGTPVRISQVVAVAAAVPGVRHAEVTKLQRLFGPPGIALDAGVLPIGPLEVAQLDDDPSRPENGWLTLDLAGGR